jgi:MFS family permease
LVTQAVTLCALGWLAIVSLTGSLELWAIFVLAAVLGLAQIFDVPARLAFVVELVGRADLQNAVGLNASLYNFARIAGPALAGLVIAAFGPEWCFVLGAVSTLAMLVALLLVRTDALFERARAGAGQTVAQGLWEGFEYVRCSRQSRIVLGLTVAIGLSGFNPLVIVPLLSSSLDTGPRAFGVLFACFGAGAVAGGLLSAGFGRTSWRMLLTGAAGIGLGVSALAVTQSVVVNGLLLLLIGLCFTVWAVNSQTILQLAAPDPLRGRIVGFYVFAVLGVQPIGGLFAGWLAEHGGVGLAFGLMGVATLGAVAVASAAAQNTPAVVDPYAPVAEPVPPS